MINGAGAPNRSVEMDNWGDVELDGKVGRSSEVQSEDVESDKERSLSFLAQLKRPIVQKVLGLAIGAAAFGGVYANWLAGSEAAGDRAGSKISQESFEQQKQAWTEKMAAEGVSETEISEVLSDPELKQVFDEMTAGDYKSFDEYLSEHGIGITKE